MTIYQALVLGAARIGVARDPAALIDTSSFDDQSLAYFGAYQCSRELRTFSRFAYCFIFAGSNAWISLGIRCADMRGFRAIVTVRGIARTFLNKANA